MQAVSSPQTPAAVKLPSQWLSVPPEIAQKLDAAVARGQALAREWAKDHGASDDWLFSALAQRKLGWPPREAEEKLELQQLHAIAATRTPAGIETAAWFSDHGMDALWDKYMQEYSRSVGAKQATAGAKLLNDTMALVTSVTQAAKGNEARPRPYTTDPTLKPTVDKPGNNPSYPSGHTSLAFAAATVLSRLLPHRASELMEMARQAAFARMYAGVHYASDIAAGAYLGATLATFMVDREQRRSGRAPAQAA